MAKKRRAQRLVAGELEMLQMLWREGPVTILQAQRALGLPKTLVRLGELVTQAPAGTAGARRMSVKARSPHRSHLFYGGFSDEEGICLCDSVRADGSAWAAGGGGGGGTKPLGAGTREVGLNASQIVRHSGARDAAAGPIYTIVYDVADLIQPNGDEANFDALVDEIQSDVAPDAWGEGKGRIAPFPTNLSLVVSQSQAIHEQMADWLQARRRTRELERTGFAPYRIEPPDVLLLHAHDLIPKPPYELDAFDVVLIRVEGALKDRAIAEAYSVQPDGTVNLGPPYGALKLAGLTPREAEIAIDEHLRQHVQAPDAKVSIAASTAARQVAGKHLVRPDGSIELGKYGSVYVAGLTIPEAEAVIMLHLSETLQDPEVTVDVFASNSKVYYVITERAAGGDNLLRLLITGNETVLDAIAAAGGIERVAETEIYVSRPAANGVGVAQILPVDWDAITRDADTRTNHQLLPGDRVFIRDKSINRELVDLAELEEEIEEQRLALDDLESKLHNRIANLEPAAIEQIIRGAEKPADSSRSATEQSREALSKGQDPAAEAFLELFGPVVSDGEVEEPTREEVREALFTARPDLKEKASHTRVVLEKIASYVDEPRNYPLVGRAQIHHTHWKVSTPNGSEQRGESSVLFVDYCRLVMVPQGDP